MLTRVLGVGDRRGGRACPVGLEGACGLLLLGPVGVAARSRAEAAGLAGVNDSGRLLGARVGQVGRAWAVGLEGACGLLLLGPVGVARRGRAEAAGLDVGNFSVLLIGCLVGILGCLVGIRGVSGAMSKWRKSFASLSVKYRVWPGGRVPRFRGPN